MCYLTMTLICIEILFFFTYFHFSLILEYKTYGSAIYFFHFFIMPRLLQDSQLHGDRNHMPSTRLIGGI